MNKKTALLLLVLGAILAVVAVFGLVGQATDGVKLTIGQIGDWKPIRQALLGAGVLLVLLGGYSFTRKPKKK
jgi:hypothetical protein